MKISTRLVATVVIAVAVVALSSCSGAGSQNTDSSGGTGACRTSGTVKIGSGATGGLYFAFSGRLTELLKESCISATTVTGSAAGFFRDGADIILTQTDQAYAGVTGTGGQGFQPGEKYEYGTFAVGWDNAGLIVAKQDAPINTVRDLTPSDVIGFSTQASADAAAEIFKLHGVSPRTAVIEDYDQTITALRQGQITAILRPVAHPLADFVRTSQDAPLKAITFDADVLRTNLQKVFPDYSITTIPAGTYDFLETDYPTWSRKTVIVAKTDLEPALAQEILRTVYERTDDLTAAVPYAKSFTLDTLEASLPSVRVPFLPAAAEYFTGRGVEVPAGQP